MIDSAIDEFLEYRRSARNNSPHTLKAYAADLSQLADFAERHQVSDLSAIDLRRLRAYLAEQAAGDRASSTLARKRSSLRAFFRWAKRTGKIARDPAAGLIAL